MMTIWFKSVNSLARYRKLPLRIRGFEWAYKWRGLYPVGGGGGGGGGGGAYKWNKKSVTK